MKFPIPPRADASPQVHSGVVDARLLAVIVAARMQRQLEFHRFLARCLKPVEVAE